MPGHLCASDSSFHLDASNTDTAQDINEPLAEDQDSFPQPLVCLQCLSTRQRFNGLQKMVETASTLVAAFMPFDSEIHGKVFSGVLTETLPR